MSGRRSTRPASTTLWKPSWSAARPDAKFLWIANTLQLAEVECGAAYLEEARGRKDLEILTPPRDLPFDAAGNLPELCFPGHPW